MSDPSRLPMAAAALAVDARCTLGEGITWCASRGAVLWTDIQASRLWMHLPAEGVTRAWTLPDRLGSMAVCRSGKLLLGLAKGLFVADIDEAAGDELQVAPRAAVEPDIRMTRVNDGRTDRAGNFVFGTMNEDEAEAPIGGFYQYSAAHGLRRLALTGVHIANSICFSLDGRTLYYCDSPRRRILCCDYDPGEAAVSKVREFVALDRGQGVPDGSVIDSDGCLWNAEWGAATVRRYTPDGRIDRTIAVPAKNPTCVAFGGPELDDLFITTARQEMTPEELARTPDAGGVYRVSGIGVRGVPDALFEGL